jgi:CDP-diacylglycerol--glycerol-3-phosphate 3-phosphatidyltransferase
MNIRQIPNILSISRILISIVLFFLFENLYIFITFYLFEGLTDILDGHLARKLHAKSSLGSKLDSIGDFVFYVLLITYLIAKHGEILMQYFGFIIIVFLFRVINIIFGFIKYKQLVMIHTIANKITGFLVFLLPILIWLERKELLFIVLIIALLSPVEEFLIILRSDKSKIDLNEKGLLKS